MNFKKGGQIKKLNFQIPTRARAGEFFFNNFVVIGFLTALTIALAWPKPGYVMNTFQWQSFLGPWRIVTTLNVGIIYLTSGLFFRTNEIKAQVVWLPVLYGTLIGLIVFTQEGWILLHIPFDKYFRYGFAIMLAGATPVSTGIAETTVARGNVSLAILLVVFTSFIACVIQPVFVERMLQGFNINVKIGNIIIRMLLNVLLPTIVGKALRESRKEIKNFVEKYRNPLQIFQNSNLICTVWLALSNSRDNLIKISFAQVFLLILTCVILTLVHLAVNGAILYLQYKYAPKKYRMEMPEIKAVFFNCSQKQLPAAIILINAIDFGLKGINGLVAVPCPVLHVSQTLISATLASSWFQYEKRQRLREEARLLTQDSGPSTPSSNAKPPTNAFHNIAEGNRQHISKRSLDIPMHSKDMKEHFRESSGPQPPTNAYHNIVEDNQQNISGHSQDGGLQNQNINYQAKGSREVEMETQQAKGSKEVETGTQQTEEVKQSGDLYVRDQNGRGQEERGKGEGGEGVRQRGSVEMKSTQSQGGRQ